uniref:Uncharacterized protein n=1 Tax=Xiphophorus maculatus TaxID=8083 RepID=A0A3B5QPM9_XIPMA
MDNARLVHSVKVTLLTLPLFKNCCFKLESLLQSNLQAKLNLQHENWLAVATLQRKNIKYCCKEKKNWTIFLYKVIKGEAFYYVPYDLDDPNLPDANITWYKDGSEVMNITTDEAHRIHYHGGALFFLNISANDAGFFITISRLIDVDKLFLICS